MYSDRGSTADLTGPLRRLFHAVFGAVPALFGVRFIPNNRVGVVERLWSSAGSVGRGALIALRGEAGYQPDVLRGGLHFGYWPWQYRVHNVPLTVVPQGRIGYVFARDGEPLPPEQTLGRVVPCENFQDVRAFLELPAVADQPRGQRGRQRAILREGVYAINLAQFVVITQDDVFSVNLGRAKETRSLLAWQSELRAQRGFAPVVIGRAVLEEKGDVRRAAKSASDTLDVQRHSEDNMGVVTVHDGPSLEAGVIIAPPIDKDASGKDHDNFQDPEAFLRAGGRRGRQFRPLTDGTFFINRWFASVEIIPKTIVPIGKVGVVVSYFGRDGEDVSGRSFRHGERVGEGQRGVRANALGPGKYAFNTYAGRVYMVPTTNFVLHWITGRTESHRFDESLKSIDLVTADAYEPVLPLSIVVHIDYQKASGVVQRFGDVKTLITQTLDPLLSAYFRDIAHKKTMLELLHDRDQIQDEAKGELCKRFANFDIELVDVLIGKPDLAEGGEIETLLDQLRSRQLAREQIRTYEHQRAAAQELRSLREAEAVAGKQTELTSSKVDVEIASNHGAADLERARQRAEQTVVTAEAHSRARELKGTGESKRLLAIGEAQAEVLQQKISSYRSPRLYALERVARSLSDSKQPLVPGRLLVAGESDGEGASGRGLLGLLGVLLAERLEGGAPLDHGSESSLEDEEVLGPRTPSDSAA